MCLTLHFRFDSNRDPSGNPIGAIVMDIELLDAFDDEVGKRKKKRKRKRKRKRGDEQDEEGEEKDEEEHDYEKEEKAKFNHVMN